MRSVVFFVAGIVAGAAMTHAGIAVGNFDDALGYYTKTLGFREARDTFLELQPATATLPSGLTHFAVEFGDLNAAVARMRQQGATVANPGLTPGKALFTRLRDQDGVSIEAMELGPESMQSKAMNAWKP